MNFSFVLIARNEEKTLPRLLKSLNEFKSRGGEVYLLDTGSTDNTVKVAKEWGANVQEVGTKFIIEVDKELADNINNRFNFDEGLIVKEGDKMFDYASARNYAAEMSKTDIIFTPDCDEEFTKLDIDKIEQAIKEGVEQFEYQFVFAHGPNGEELIKFLHCKAYDRRKLKWQGVIHEILIGNAKRQYFTEDVIKLEHWQNHETNRGHYLTGLAMDCYLNQNNDRNSHYFARELMWSGFLKSAEKEFERHLTISGWDAERSQSMIYLGNITNDINWYFKAFIECPNRREALIKLGEYFYNKGDYKRAIPFLEACLSISYSGFYADNAEHYKDVPHAMLYPSYWRIGNKEKSKEHFDKCIEFYPDKYLGDYQFYYDLPKISILIPTLKRPEGLKRCLDSIEKIIYPKDKLEVLVEEDEPRIGVAKRLNKLFKQSTGDLIVYGSNDIEFTPNCLIEVVKYNEDLIAFNTGEVLPDEGNICEHFAIKRSYVETNDNKIFDEDFNHVGVDNLLWTKCKSKVRADKAIIKHYHFSKGGQMDDIYELGWSEVEKDRELLKEKLKYVLD